ncbi:ribonucleoside-diphosphate reductase, adenosylcobalamin-dependent [Candidatus Wirthbacteria bacterium CG2_30_54_11]|uniref:Vitamin B12-dependent ribonucleotide reductase n=1 Tax=Candidatus Wirthbacteria bacterium CG2_30_54_11 TaxID=1817892 RepID=A0A1J5IYN1_9BACT|nr:MAG: ribonucleoside-diphosphate reductase, adenosylcobalamin-dependent [Candidatus Wirthbacteria bacterium CG2_30_54_11]
MSSAMTPKQIKKRDGRVMDFDPKKIGNAIYKAAREVGIKDDKLAEDITERVVMILEKRFNGGNIPTVEQVQDIVEEALIILGQIKIGKAYILYREERKDLREAKAIILDGAEDELKLTLNATKVLERRYLLKDEEGKVIETPKQMFERVAKAIAKADAKYGTAADVKKSEQEFLDMMENLEFMPNSPTLMNAGTEMGQLSACFVLPVEDAMDKIFDSLKNTALIHQTGGGTGFSFSRLRPKDDIVKSTGGIASGPISFMRVFDMATEVIKQGGRRRGANMGILRVDHPDILEFIVAKEKNNTFNNFNISVGITEKFMQAVEKNQDYDIINPRSHEPIRKLNARKVFDLIVTMAWKNGEPGIIFLDRLNKDNPTPELGEIESTNPCGEQPLLPYESCNLGSINLSKMIKWQDGKSEVDWVKFESTVRKAVHFLDNVIDESKFPLEAITELVHGNRKVGLGAMGWADMLILLGISYNSDAAINLADRVMGFIHDKAREASMDLAKTRGVFPNWGKSIFKEKNLKLRNATLTTIAPTGTISVIADASSGIEPLFAVSYIRNVMDNTELLEVNKYFEEMAKDEGFFSDDLMRRIARQGHLVGIEDVPQRLRTVFVTAHEISPEWHIRMQAVFQKHIDNAVSKTVNFSHDATTEDIEKAYLLAWRLGCKGVTVYRDHSRDEQVLNIDKVNRKIEEAAVSKRDPEIVQELEEEQTMVKVSSEYSGGCVTCTI